MAFCERCGGELPVAARFCPACGRPVEPEVGPPAPPPAASVWAGVRLPGWATADWALVGLGAAVLLGLLFVVSALLGLAAAVAVAGSFEVAPCGAAVGSHLAFAAFGARTAAACGGEHGAALALGFLPLPWALAGGLATEAALRFAWGRLPDDQPRRAAYVGKLALSCGVALGVIAGLVDQGDPSNRGSGFASSLNGGEVWFYSSVLICFWGWIALRRRGVKAAGAGIGRAGRWAGQGAAVFAALTAGLAVVGLLVSLAVTDGVHRRVGLLFGFPVVGFSFGAALVDGAMGAALGGVSGHTSLARFGLPAGPDAGAAPVWVFAAVLLAPAAVAAAVWRRLEREQPVEEQGALAVGAATAVGFAAAAWVTALVGRIVVLAAVSRSIGGFVRLTPETAEMFRRESVGALVALRPNPAAVLGLGLLWGLVGGLGAAFLWASRHNARWQVSGAAGGPEASPAPPSATGPTSSTETTQVSGPSAWLLPETEVTPGGPGTPPPPSSERNVGQDAGAAGDPPEKP